MPQAAGPAEAAELVVVVAELELAAGIAVGRLAGIVAAAAETEPAASAAVAFVVVASVVVASVQGSWPSVHRLQHNR